MQTPILPLELGKDYGYKTESGEDIVVKVPRSVPEGFVYELGLIGGDELVGAAQAEAVRDTQIRVLELVRWWNVDDDKGTVLPTIASIVNKDKAKERADRIKVLELIPVEITKAVVDKVTASSRVNPRVEGF